MTKQFGYIHAHWINIKLLNNIGTDIHFTCQVLVDVRSIIFSSKTPGAPLARNLNLRRKERPSVFIRSIFGVIQPQDGITLVGSSATGTPLGQSKSKVLTYSRPCTRLPKSTLRYRTWPPATCARLLAFSNVFLKGAQMRPCESQSLFLIV